MSQGVLSAIAYGLLALDLFKAAHATGLAAAQRNGAQRTRINGAPQLTGPVSATRDPRRSGPISASAMRDLSPVFRPGQPARVRTHDARTLTARLARIKDLINKGSQDPGVRATAISVLSRRKPGGGWAVAEKDWKGEANAMFAFVRHNVRYTRDHADLDVYVHPARTLFDIAKGSGGGGDCDDYTITLGALLKAVGHDMVARVAAVKNPGEAAPDWNHIWLINILPEGGAVARKGKAGGYNRGYPLDASVDGPPGWQAPASRIVKFRDFPI